jgi:hypothetical protein
MAKIRQTGRTRPAQPWLSLLAWGSLGLMTGCSGGPTASNQPHDPLHGIMTPPGAPLPNSAPKADASTPLAPNQPGVAALPASMSSSNPATLAGASWQGPLGQPTRIDDNNSAGPPFMPGQSTLGSKTQQIPFNANPKVEAVPDVKGASPAVTPNSTWLPPQSAPVQPVAAAQPINADIAKQLQDRGVIDQKQDVVPDGVRLTCYLQRPTGGLRILEVTAADYFAAARAIVQQIDGSR